MNRRHQDIRIWSVQDRRKDVRHSQGWVVRWVVDGKQISRSFRTRTLADRFRSELLLAHDRGATFDRSTGIPESWSSPAADTNVYQWARRWLDEQWEDWQPRTQASAVEALARFIPLAVGPNAIDPPPTMRSYLVSALVPGVDIDVRDERERWLQRASLVLADLSRDRLAVVEQRLAQGIDGSQLSPSTFGRYRKVSRACIRRAVDLGLLENDPWPPPARGRSGRKNAKQRPAFDLRKLPDPATMRAAIDAIETHQPGSRTYKVMTAVAYYAGLRPSEVVMLRKRALDLPDSGWGVIDVVEADIAYDVAGEPKTGPRSVPIPPVLVQMLREWTAEMDDGDLLFRTRNGKRPTPSNWTRAWHRALRSIGHEPLRVYDCRHAAATTWLQAGAPLGEVARRLGHSVETLVSVYVGAIAGDEELANERIGRVMS